MSVAAFPKEAQSWLGKLPSDWQVKPLKHVVRVNPEALSDATDPDWRMTYADISSVSLGQGIVDAEELAFADAPLRARRLVRTGDTLISTVRTYLRAITMVREPPENLVASTGFAVLRPGPAIDPNFLGYFATSDAFVNAVVAQSVGVSYPATNASDIVRLPIAYPDSGEQQKIADFLDRKTAEIDALIEKKRRLLDLLAEKRTALITGAVTKGLNPDAPTKHSGIEWLGEIPAHWEVKPLKFIATVNPEKISETTAPDWEMEYADISSVSLGQGVSETEVLSFAEAPSRARRVVRAGDTLISTVRTYLRAITMVRSAPPNLIATTGFAVLRPQLEVDPAFLGYFATSDGFVNAVVSRSVGVSYPAITALEIGRLPIALPQIREQRDIVAYIESQLASSSMLLGNAKAGLQKLLEYRAGLITDAVTGKIKVS